MSRIRIRRRHALTHSQVRARVQHVAERLAERFEAAWEWDGDRLQVQHSSLTGHVSVRKREVVVEGRLGFALGLFHDLVAAEIGRILDEELKRKA